MAQHFIKWAVKNRLFFYATKYFYGIKKFLHFEDWIFYKIFQGLGKSVPCKCLQATLIVLD